MSELQILFAVLVAFYLYQCVVWIPQDAAAFRSALFSGWKLETGGFRLAVGRLRAVSGNPLPPLNGVVVCPAQLALVTPLGVLRTERGAEVYTPFQKLEQITADGKYLRAGEGDFGTAVSANEAERFAAWIESLRGMAEKKRGAAIEKRQAASLDHAKAAERLAEYRDGTMRLEWTCTALFSYLFVFLPLTVEAVGLARVWPALLAALVMLAAAIAWQFRRAHRTLYPEGKDGRWEAVLTIVLSPVAAVRARDVLVRELFSGFHPLAVARVLCAPEEYRRVAERMLREFTYPIPGSVGEHKDAAAAECEASYRERMGAAMRRAVADGGVKPEELLAPPAPNGPQSESYCPRCCQQYAVASGACADCGGIPLEPLERAVEKISGN